MLRAVAKARAAVNHARQTLDRIAQIPVDDQVLDRASTIVPGVRLRSLDAIHLASVELVPDLTALVTYDSRLADAAAHLGFPVAVPA